MFCFAQCDPGAALQELVEVCARVDEGGEREAKKSPALAARGAGGCAEDVRLDDPDGARRQFERAWAIVKDRREVVLRPVVMVHMSVVARELGRTEEARARMEEAQRDLRRLPPAAQRDIEGMSLIKTLR
jgi:hypothetical protein